jgi:hypothetical protein
MLRCPVVQLHAPCTHGCELGIMESARCSDIHVSCRSGAAAAGRDRKKTKSYEQVPGTYEFVPLSMETYGTLGIPAEELIVRLAHAAHKANRTDSVETFVRLAQSELSMALCRGNSVLYRCYHEHWAKGGDRWQDGQDSSVAWLL